MYSFLVSIASSPQKKKISKRYVIKNIYIYRHEDVFSGKGNRKPIPH